MLKEFEVTLKDCLQFKRILILESSNAATLELGLNATLGMAGCQILKIVEYIPADTALRAG
jgi:hypothetical protein